MSYRQLPNQLTVLRLFLAGVFFVLLNFYRYPEGTDQWLLRAIERQLPHGPASLLLVVAHEVLLLAVAVFILAALTDWLDGFLARRWHVESAFGRIMDPFCDKVLVLGAFIYLAGPRFVEPEAVRNLRFFNMVTGVYPWMVALMLARELLVTNVRGEMESQGISFGANLFGKLKMVLQAVGIPIILVIVWLDPRRPDRLFLSVVRDVLVYATVIATVLSGIPYIRTAARSLGASREPPPDPRPQPSNPSAPPRAKPGDAKP